MLAAISESDAEIEADTGPRDRKVGTERLCVATRTVRPVAEMMRFVLDPAGELVPDLKRRLPGRGVWVSAERQALATAVARNAFARSLKRPVKVSAALVAQTEDLLERAVLDALGMARKAGLAETGFTKVEAALRQKPVLALVQAAEAAPDGVRKMAAARLRSGAEADTVPVLVFAGMQLDLAFGRPNVIHAALLAGPASETVLTRYRHLERFRGGEPAKPAAQRGE